MVRAVGLLALWVALTAATPLPLAPPPPDLAPLLPFAAAPLDKPAIAIDLVLPPVPVDLPPLAPVPVLPPVADKPMAFLQSPRTLPCIGSWFGVASESLECGRARFQRGEYEDAAKAFDQAVRGGTERELLREARYWLGETYYKLGRFEQADWLFRQVAQESIRHEWGAWSLHSSGWTALRLRDPARAREAFSQMSTIPLPAPLDSWGRHGLGLALYTLGRYPEAEREWATLIARLAPPALWRDVLFWHGEVLGRTGQHAAAAVALARFTEGGAHPLLGPGFLQRGWWSLAAGDAAQAALAFSAYLALPTAPERDAAQGGLASAQLAAGDWAGARKTVAGLQARRAGLALPMMLRLARDAVDAPPGTTDTDALVQELLSSSLTAPVRAWVLLVKGEADRAAGHRDEARTNFDLARTADPAGPASAQAVFRLARTNFELREFSQTVSDLAPLASARLTPDVRLAILLLQGEAAYHAGDYVVASAAFRRVLVEYPGHAPARLAAGWTALRQARAEEARRDFVEFARAAPDHPHAADALVLAAELALEAGAVAAARELLERIVVTYPAHPRTDVARLNRAVLMARTGQNVEARAALSDWLARAPFPALFGRARAALGVVWLASGRPAEAVHEFGLADKEGVGALAQLGFGAAALAQSRWDDAVRPLAQARDTGPPDIAASAEYGLAVAAFHRGVTAEFTKAGRAALAAARADAARTGALLYALTGAAVQDKDWPGALAYARRLVTEQKAHPAADDALERVGAGAADAQAWPVTYEAYALMRRLYPQSPFGEDGRVRFAQAALQMGKPDVARIDLDQFIAASPTDPRVPQALLILARAREQSGDRAGALEAYGRAVREGSAAEWTGEARLAHARLLAQDKRWAPARAAFERLLTSPEPAVVVEAASGIADAYAGEGDHLAAAEHYMTAAYVGPDTALGRRALLGAARAFVALKQDESAAIAYRKLLAQSDVPPDLADGARRGLAALGR
ncbi:MAG: tetratricopeptide repeat protein [Candidatus Rokuibacteriota bacterium]